MAGRLIALLKWGGLALAAINVAAIAYVWSIGAPASLGPGPESQDAPYTGYLIVMVIGIVAAAAGFILERRGRAQRQMR